VLSKLLILGALLPPAALAQMGGGIDLYDPINFSSTVCGATTGPTPQEKLAFQYRMATARLTAAQAALPALRADERAKSAAFDVALNAYRRALNGDETPSPLELQIIASSTPFAAALQSFYSFANNRAMWQDSLAELRQLGASFDAEGRTQADLQKFITSIESDQARWTATYGSFEAVFSKLLQYEDQLTAARAQRGAIDVKALRLARQNAELAFDTAKSKRRDAESQIEALQAQLVKIAALQRAAQNCAQPADAQFINLIATGRCGTPDSFPTNAYSNQTFRLNPPNSGAGPVSGNFTMNTADSISRPIAPGPNNTITGFTNGNTASGNWTLAGVKGTWYGEIRMNASGKWESNGTLCNRIDENTGCVFRWSQPQITTPIVTPSDLRRCLN
jgi:hypothetical protein